MAIGFPSPPSVRHAPWSAPPPFPSTAPRQQAGVPYHTSPSAALPTAQAAAVSYMAAPPVSVAGAVPMQRVADSGDALEGEKLHMDGVGCNLLGERAEEVKSQIQVVSLGSYCGVKMSARRLGLGEASLPFDWIRTRVEGLLHWLQHGFGTLFHVQNLYEMVHQGAPLTVYRSNVHSFWHDNIQDEEVRDKLWRRVRRFENLSQGDNRALLFVRVLAGTQELPQTEVLYDCLKQKFESAGRKVCLLIIIDDQPLVGPIQLVQTPNILVWVQPLFKGGLAMDKPAPFEEAIACAVRYYTGDQSQQSANWPAVDNIAAITDPESPFRASGLKETGAGLIAGHVLLKGQSQETMFAAFEGLDNAQPPSSPSAANQSQSQPQNQTQSQAQQQSQPPARRVAAPAGSATPAPPSSTPYQAPAALPPHSAPLPPPSAALPPPSALRPPSRSSRAYYPPTAPVAFHPSSPQAAVPYSPVPQRSSMGPQAPPTAPHPVFAF